MLVSKIYNLNLKKHFGSLTPLEAFGRLFALVVFLYYIVQLFSWEFLYGSHSAVPVDFVTQYYNPNLRPLIYIFPQQDWAMKLWLTSMLLVLIQSVFFKTPIVLKLWAWFVHIMFFYRIIPAALGEDFIINAFFMFYVFSDVKSIRIKKYLLKTAQIQMLVVYFVAGVSKLLGSQWRSGTALAHIASSDIANLVTLKLVGPLLWLSMLLTWIVVAFEVLAPLGFGLRLTRKYWVVFGVLLHTLSAIYLGVWVFSFLMIATYALYKTNPITDRERV